MTWRSHCTKTYVALMVVGSFLTILGGVLFPVGDWYIRHEVKKKVTIANNSDSKAFEIWVDNPIPVYMQYYLFNVDNKQEILDGEKPALSQRGPYTYREFRPKFDIVWNENGTVTYRQNRTYHFVREMSVGDETDVITTLNPLLASIAQDLKNLPASVRSIVSAVISLSGDADAFIRRPVRELLWGYQDPILVTLHKLLPSQYKDATVGYFIRKNYTDEGLFTVETGANDINHLGTIREYNWKTHADIWTTPWCNMVNGTDGSCAPPFMFDDDNIVLFQADVCRSLRLDYHRKTSSPQGIKLRRYRFSPLNFANYSDNPNNLGFCTPECLPSGLHNSMMCEKPFNGVRVPLVVSQPHFLFTEPQIQNSVIGFHPNREEHETHMDIEPWTGFPMRIEKRMQVNFFVEKVEGIRQLKNIRRLYFPIMWFNESVVIDDKHADQVKDELFLPMDILLGAEISFLVLGGLMILSSIGLFCRRRYNASRTRESTLEITSKSQPKGNGIVSYGTNGYTNPL